MRFTIEPQDLTLFRQTFRTWGESSQVLQAIQECAELIDVLTKVQLAQPGVGVVSWGDLFDNVADEMADVYTMLGQLAVCFNLEERVNRRIEFKLKRLELLLVHHTDELDKSPAL